MVYGHDTHYHHWRQHVLKSAACLCDGCSLLAAPIRGCCTLQIHNQEKDAQWIVESKNSRFQQVPYHVRNTQTLSLTHSRKGISSYGGWKHFPVVPYTGSKAQGWPVPLSQNPRKLTESNMLQNITDLSLQWLFCVSYTSELSRLLSLYHTFIICIM